MAKEPELKEPEKVDDKPRFCMYHRTEMVSVPPVGTIKYGMKEKKVLKTWVCKGDKNRKCSYTIHIVE